MINRFPKLVIASNNQGKIQEIEDLLESHHLEVVPQSEFSVPSIEESGLSFIENAILKARHASQYSDLPSVADDSGLEVNCLEGAPGIRSARFAGDNATDKQNIDKLLLALKDVPSDQRVARFHCAMVFMRYKNDPAPITATGIWHGRILTKPRGENGFGYDSVFFIPSHRSSVADLSPAIKNRLSHRSQALKKLVVQMKAEWLGPI